MLLLLEKTNKERELSIRLWITLTDQSKRNDKSTDYPPIGLSFMSVRTVKVVYNLVVNSDVIKDKSNFSE